MSLHSVEQKVRQGTKCPKSGSYMAFSFSCNFFLLCESSASVELLLPELLLLKKIKQRRK